jgi:peptide/nickel transport system substrate-binding protein
MARHRGLHPILLLCALALLLNGRPAAEAAEKIFYYGLEGEPESLDWAKAASLRAERVTWLLCDSLVNTSKDGQSLEPGLAQSWSASPDGRRVVVKVRPGVQFHDGTSLDAGAIKVNFDRQFRPSHSLYTSEPPNAKEAMLAGLIEDIEVQDSLTLVLRLKYPGLHYLSEVHIVSPTALAKLGKGFGRNPVCTGPFRFESWSADRIELLANDKYWAGRPRIDRVVFRINADGKALADALLRGEVDFVPVLPDPSYFERVRESATARLASIPGLNIFYLGFYTDRAPFNAPAFRKATVQAVNVPRIAQYLGRGTVVAARGPLPPAMKAYDPAVTQAAFDPQASLALLRKSGYEQPPGVRLVYNSALMLISELAGAIQSDLQKVGIKVELLGKPGWREVVEAARAREGDMFIYNWHVSAPYPERILMPLFHSRSAGTSNLTHYKSPAVDRMLDEAKTLPEAPEQKRLYSQIQTMIVEDAPMVFLFHSSRMGAYASRVQGLALRLDVAPDDKLVKVDLSP